jgi:hypothetical protein
MKSLREYQAEAGCEIGIVGAERWQDHLADELPLNNGWDKVLGRPSISAIDFADEYAKRHGLGHEWGIAIELLNRGYTFEELEVEFRNAGPWDDWGRCVWYKEHPSYDQPLPEPYVRFSIFTPRLVFAMWRTENAGDQKACFHTSSFGGAAITPRKTIIFHKMVFVPPTDQENSQAA